LIYGYDNPELAGELPTNDDVMDSIPSTQMEIVEDQPFVERISPFDMFIDPEATCMEDAKWIAQRIVRPIEEVRRDKRFRKGVRQNLQADSGLKVRWENDDERDQYSDLIERVTLYEYYDLEEGLFRFVPRVQTTICLILLRCHIILAIRLF
jgi:hypothetical protein